MNLWIDQQALIVICITAAVLVVVLNVSTLFPSRGETERGNEDA